MLAGTIEFDLSVRGQIGTQLFSDRQGAEALNCSIALCIEHFLLNYVRQGTSVDGSSPGCFLD